MNNLNSKEVFKKPASISKKAKKSFKLNKKSLIYIIIGSLSSVIFFVSLITSAFGLGYQSYLFSNKTRSSVNKYIDKTHLVFDPQVMSSVDKTMIPTILKESYLIDALSTLTAKQLLNSTKFNNYLDFAENGFSEDWIKTGYITSNALGILTIQKPINLNTFALTLLNFDLNVGKKFVSPLVSTGLGWIFAEGGYADLISTNWQHRDYYQYVNTLNVIVNQNQYNVKMNAFADMILFDSALGINFNKTIFETFIKDYPQYPGFNLVNNKLWFINWQIHLLKDILKGDNSNAFFSKSNAAYYQQNPRALSYLSLSDFVNPNYKQAYFQARVGAVMLTIVTPIIFTIGIGLTLFMRFFVIYDRENKKLLFKNRFTKKTIRDEDSKSPPQK